MSDVFLEVTAWEWKKDRDRKIQSTIRPWWGLGNAGEPDAVQPPVLYRAAVLSGTTVSGSSVLHRQLPTQAIPPWIPPSVPSQAEPLPLAEGPDGASEGSCPSQHPSPSPLSIYFKTLVLSVWSQHLKHLLGGALVDLLSRRVGYSLPRGLGILL